MEIKEFKNLVNGLGISEEGKKELIESWEKEQKCYSAFMFSYSMFSYSNFGGDILNKVTMKHLLKGVYEKREVIEKIIIALDKTLVNWYGHQMWNLGTELSKEDKDIIAQEIGYTNFQDAKNNIKDFDYKKEMVRFI